MFVIIQSLNLKKFNFYYRVTSHFILVWLLSLFLFFFLIYDIIVERRRGLGFWF